MEDHEIIRRVKEGESDLFEILVRRHEGKLYALAWRMLRNRADVEDAVQESFMKAYRSLNRFRGSARFSTWLYRIAVNNILNKLRRQSRDKRVDIDLDRMQSIATPQREVHNRELEQAVARAIDSLPARQRAIFHMRYEEERPHAEIAHILNLSEGAVKASYHHAVAKLRQALGEYVYSREDE